MDITAVSKKGRGCRFDTIATPRSFEEAKILALKCAEQLGYYDSFPEMKSKLRKAKSISEINHLMGEARRAM